MVSPTCDLSHKFLKNRTGPKAFLALTALGQPKTPMMEATVVALFRRRTDLGDHLPKPACYEVKSTTNHTTFARLRVDQDTPAPCGLLGLTDSIEWSRAKRSLYARLERPEDGNERALSVQTTAHFHSVEQYASGLENRLKKPLPRMEPGGWGENLHLDGGPEFHSGAVCVGDDFTVWRGQEKVLQLQVASPRRCDAHLPPHTGSTMLYTHTSGHRVIPLSQAM